MSKQCAGRNCTADKEHQQHSDACLGDYLASTTVPAGFLEAHHADDFNRHLKILPARTKSAGGAPTGYRITGFNTATAPTRAGVELPVDHVELEFQHGDPVTTGVHGITNEVLLAVMMHRLAAFQQGPHACDQNAEALHHMHLALQALQRRQP